MSTFASVDTDGVGPEAVAAADSGPSSIDTLVSPAVAFATAALGAMVVPAPTVGVGPEAVASAAAALTVSSMATAAAEPVPVASAAAGDTVGLLVIVGVGPSAVATAAAGLSVSPISTVGVGPDPVAAAARGRELRRHVQHRGRPGRCRGSRSGHRHRDVPGRRHSRGRTRRRSHRPFRPDLLVEVFVSPALPDPDAAPGTVTVTLVVTSG